MGLFSQSAAVGTFSSFEAVLRDQKGRWPWRILWTVLSRSPRSENIFRIKIVGLLSQSVATGTFSSFEAVFG